MAESRASIFWSDDVIAGSAFAEPFVFTATTPSGVTSASVGAIAVDTNDNEGVALAVPINVRTDPLTTLSGSVVDITGEPVAGALVTATATISGVTDANGLFTLSGVSTANDVQARATAAFDGRALHGTSVITPPVSGGVDAGGRDHSGDDYL